MAANQPNAIAVTAKWVAAARALESQRTDALFHDPYASSLAGKEGLDWINNQPTNEAQIALAVRTRFLDDLIQRCLNETAIRQVVILAAGLDSRAFRLPFPKGTKVFEVDQEGVLEYKNRILEQHHAKPTCERITISANLEFPWVDKLINTSFNSKEPAFWLIEGLLYYLDAAAVHSLLSTVSQIAVSGSWLAFDAANKAMMSLPTMKESLEYLKKVGAPWKFFLDDPQLLLKPLNWDAKVTSINEAGNTYGRWAFPGIGDQKTDELPTMFFAVGHRKSIKDLN